MRTLLLWLIALVTGGVAGMIGYGYWTDHEELKAERKQQRRIELESCLRHRPPQVVSFREKASKGFQR